MASVINTNMASLYAQKNLTGAQSALSTSVERLSSGLRINRAKDDAAGLGISEKLKSQIVSLNQGIRNANDAVSMVQTAEGSLSEVSNILQRMKELAVQGRNESLSDVQRAYIADELTALKKEVNAIAERTTFNGMSLLKNALRTQVADAVGATNQMVSGASLASGLVIENLKVDGANVGSYSVKTRTDSELASVSEVSAKNTSNPLSARTITINAGDVFEGAKISVTVAGETYSTVADKDDDNTTIATALVAKLSRNFEANVTASTNTIVFASNASVGDEDITIQLSELSASQEIESVRSTVDSPYDAAATERKITINDHDIVEGRKVTVTVGNPTEVASFSVIIGGGTGVTKSSVAQDLYDLISKHFTNSSHASGVITFSSSANLGMAEIGLKFEDTVATNSDLTLSSVTSKNNQEAPRTIEINENDIEQDRVFSVMINGKEYAHRVVEGDTDVSIANKLSSLIDDDYPSVAGTAVAPSVSVTSGSAANESSVVTFKDLIRGDKVTVAGLTFEATAATVTAANVAAAFASLSAGATIGNGSNGRFSGTLTAFSSSGASGDDVTFSATSTGVNVTDLAVSTAQRAASTATDITVAVGAGTDGTIGSPETTVFTFTGSGMNNGDAITIEGLTFTATRDLSISETLDAFASLNAGATTGGGSGYGVYSGTLAAGWNLGAKSGSVSGSTITATATANGDAGEASRTVSLRTASTSSAATQVITQGGATQVEFADVQFNAADMKAGDSITVGGLRFTAKSRVTQAQVAAAFANLFDGAVSGDGLEYGVYTGKLRGYTTGSVIGTSDTVRFTSTAATGVNVPNLTVSASPVVQAVSTGGSNTITLSSTGAKLGLADIDFRLFGGISDAGKLKLSANADTGIGGVSQAIEMGSIAAGVSKSFNFDQLGVSFSVKNTGTASVNAADLFGVVSSQLDTLSVTSAMNGEALFQVGAAVRDTVVIDGFKDIRITGSNKNDSQAEREVFNNIHSTMAAIEGGNVDESIFATLETQVEEAITTVSTFRSYFGAQQNRIDYAIANLQAQSENITEANSRIRDTDYAAETANLTKTQIMQQAATAMLAQANQMPNVILALLK